MTQKLVVTTARGTFTRETNRDYEYIVVVDRADGTAEAINWCSRPDLAYKAFNAALKAGKISPVIFRVSDGSLYTLAPPRWASKENPIAPAPLAPENKRIGFVHLSADGLTVESCEGAAAGREAEMQAEVTKDAEAKAEHAKAEADRQAREEADKVATKPARPPSDPSTLGRPAHGTTTGTVWELMDECNGDKAAAKKLADERCINPSTFNVQANKWRKAQELAKASK